MPPLKVEVFAQEQSPAQTRPSASKSRSTAELEVDYDEDITRLYEAITNEDWDAAIEAVADDPAEARTWVVRHHPDGTIMWRFLPLHSACARQPPTELVSALLDAYRAGASARDDQGLYPLHYACGNQAGSDTIRLLVLSHPTATSEADPSGMLPLHYLAKWGPADKLSLDILLLANKDVVTAKIETGQNALDLAKEGDYEDKDSIVASLRALTPDAKEDREEASTTAEDAPSMDEETAEDAETKDEAGEDEASVEESVESTEETRNIALEEGSAKIASLTSTSRRQRAAHSAAIAELKSQIATLRTEKKEAAAAHEEQLAMEKAELRSQIIALEEKLEKAEEANSLLSNEQSNKDEFLRYIEGKLAQKDYEMIGLQKEAKKHREANVELKKKHEKLSKTYETVDSRFFKLSSSVKKLLEDQDKIATAVAKRDALFKKATQRRQKKMQELINMEVELTKEAVLDEREGEASHLSEALERQRKELDSVRDIVEEAREDGIVSIMSPKASATKSPEKGAPKGTPKAEASPAPSSPRKGSRPKAEA